MACCSGPRAPNFSWPSKRTARGDVWGTRKDGAGHKLNGRHDYIKRFPPGGLPPNVQTHIFVASLTLLIHRAIEKKLQSAGLDLSATEALSALESPRVVDIALADGSSKRCVTQPTRRVAAILRARHLCHQAANPAAARSNHPVETNCEAGVREINDLRAKNGNIAVRIGQLTAEVFHLLDLRPCWPLPVPHVPDMAGRYHSVQFTDPNNTNFAYVGKRTTGTDAGDYLIVGPGWRRAVPRGMAQFSSPNGSVLVIGRVFVANDGDLPTTYALAKLIQVVPLTIRQPSQ